MPLPAISDPATLLSTELPEESADLDHLARSFLRTLARLPLPAVVAIQGAPGSGKDMFLVHCATVLRTAIDTLGPEAADRLVPDHAWYNPWLQQRHGSLLAGLVMALARVRQAHGATLDPARELLARIARMRFDEQPAGGLGAVLDGGELDPIERIRVSLRAMCAFPGEARLVAFIQDTDLLPPSGRLQLLEGLRTLLDPETRLVVVIDMGRESALAAIRQRDARLSEGAADRVLATYVDLALNLPDLEIRRIGGTLRRLLQPHEALLQAAFGADALAGLTAAAAHQPFGDSGFLRRLSARVIQLAGFAVETRTRRELSEAQWAWVLVSERWPGFRRHVIRGGSRRWDGLLKTVAGPGPTSQASPDELGDRLRHDPVLAAYLREHGDTFEREPDAIGWIESLLRAAAL